MTSRSERWSKALEMGRPDRVVFDVSGGALWLENQPLGRVRYGLIDGSVENDELRERLLVGGDGFAILALIEGEVGAGVPPSRREHLVEACLRAADRLSSYPTYAAHALRIAGEIVEPYAPARTIDYWDRALGLDPHVGVAKRAAALRAMRR